MELRAYVLRAYISLRIQTYREKALAVAALRKEAEANSANGGTLEKDVDAQITRLSPGKYRIKSYEVGFGADVVVFLINDKGEDANIVVRYGCSV